MTWRYRVYGKTEQENYDLKKWIKLSNKVLHRDRYKCRICGIGEEEGGVKAHHIIPRNKGGNDDFDNLISLCNDCHDDIELEEFDNYEHFWEYFKETKWLLREKYRKYKLKIKEESPDLDFHKWVYGGYRNPRVSKTNEEINKYVKEESFIYRIKEE